MDIGTIEYPNKITKADYFIVALLFALGGNALFIDFKWYAFVTTAMMIILCKSRNLNLKYKKVLHVLFVFLFVALLQILFLPKVSLPAYINFSFKIFAGFLMMSYLGDKFRMAYFKVCTFFCAISLVFWAIHLIRPFSGGIDIGYGRSFLIWSYRHGESSLRNEGMFWEPGAFQGYIMFVPIFFIDKLKELWKYERRSCIILIAALASTMSTTGYVVFIFLVGMYLVKGIRNMFVKLFLITIFSLGTFFAFTTFNFLGEKITSQYENVVDLDYSQEGAMQTRMGTMIIDMELIQRHPVIGNSFDMKTKYGIYTEILSSAGNGLSSFIASLGVPFFVFYVLIFLKSLPAIDIYYKIIGISSMLLILYGEVFYNFIPFWTLLFITYRQDDYLIYTKRK